MARVSEMIGHHLSNEEERSFSAFVGRQSGVTHWDTIKLRAKVEEWQIKGAFPASVNFNGLDWSNGGDALMVNVTIAYDYAVLQF